MNLNRLFRQAVVVLLLITITMILISPSVTYSAPGAPDATPVIIDLEISIHKSTVPPADRTKYEKIIEYFADAVFEASEGENKIGKVTFYEGGVCVKKADVVWKANCHPEAAVSGRGKDNWNVTFCDVFKWKDDKGNPQSIDFLLVHEAGGYTLAHEWGHYYYSLYDEYVGVAKYDSKFAFPHSTDDPVPDAIMNAQYKAVGGNYKWLNFSIAKNYQKPGGGTRVTAQSRCYGASAWETLARAVSADPQVGPQAGLTPRIHHPELAAVAPAAGTDAAIDLPNSAARSALNVVWGSCSIAYQIVIDKSGSMDDPKKLPNVKKAAKLLVDLAPVKYSTIGVIAYNDTVTVVQPLTDITSTADKTTIKNKIDAIKPGGYTAIGDAAKKALDDMLASAEVENKNKVVYLLSDGKSNRGIAPLSVIPSYKAAKIPLYTFAYGDDADKTLMQKLANDTGGKYYFSPTTLLDITNAFQAANLQTSPSVGISSGAKLIPSTADILIPNAADFVPTPIHVDSTLSHLDVVVVYEGALGDLEFELVTPDKYPYYYPDYCEESESQRETICYFGVNIFSEYEVGEWELRTWNLSDEDIMMYGQASGLSDTFTYAASLTAFPGDALKTPQPVTLLAVLGKEIPIMGAFVDAIIQNPNGSEYTLAMRDDGEPPDAVKDDGHYTAVFEPGEEGAYNIAVQFYGEKGVAKMTSRSYSPSQPPDGTTLPPEDIPVTEDFERFARIQVNIDSDFTLDDDFIYLPLMQR